MKSICIILVGLLISFAGTAQTKRIGQRSDSSSSGNFIVDSEDNFGISPEMSRKKIEEREAQAKKRQHRCKGRKRFCGKSCCKRN